MVFSLLGWSDALLGLLLVTFAYPFVIYPLLMAILGRSRKPAAPPADPADWPDVALIVCALNEESVIGEKIENSLALDYPGGRLSIVVVSDGSTDRTAEIARRSVPRIELIERPQRRGKVSNLNEVIGSRTEAVIALSDANVIYDRNALRHLVARMADPQIGCVSGKVVLIDTSEQLEGPERDYYSVEWMLQETESALYSMVGADGAMYALRRELFQPCPDDTLIEDLVIPMGVVRQGSRVVLEPRAVGWEKGVAGLSEEFARKVRIAAGAAQALLRGNAWPGRAPLGYWWVFVSHKLLRWLSPFVAAAALVTAALTPGSPLSRVVLVGTSVLVLMAALRLGAGWRWKPADGAFYLLFGQIAVAWGMVKGFTGRQSVLWAKRNR